MAVALVVVKAVLVEPVLTYIQLGNSVPDMAVDTFVAVAFVGILMYKSLDCME